MRKKEFVRGENFIGLDEPELITIIEEGGEGK